MQTVKIPIPIESFCRFLEEEAWIDGRRPPCEKLLDDLQRKRARVPPKHWSTFCECVISLHVQLRADDGDEPTIEDYLRDGGGNDDVLRETLEVAFVMAERPRPPLVERFSHVTPLGCGGFGDVYLARDTKFGDRLVAIKIPRNEKGKELLEREAQLLGQLRADPELSELIIEGHDWTRLLTGVSALVLRYHEHTLATLVCRLAGSSRGVPAELAVYLVERIAQVVHRLHAQDPPLYHRDLKPENILLNEKGLPTIIDLGLVVSESELRRSSDTIDIGGTALYMSPEYHRAKAINDRQSYGAKDDVWSLFVILYELLAGVRPFNNLEAVLNETVARGPLESMNVAGDLVSLVCFQGLNKDPKQRSIQTPADLAKMLRTWRVTPPRALSDGPVNERLQRLLGWLDDPEADISDTLHPVQADTDVPSVENLEEKGLERLPDEKFVGRATYFPQIDAGLAASGRVAIERNLPGVGKSTLALQYITDPENGYRHRIWIPAENRESIQTALAQVAKTLANLDKDLETREAQAMMGKRELRRLSRAVVVFDNVERWDVVSSYVPKGPDVIFTCRRGNVDRYALHSIFSVAVESLSDAAGVDLLQRRSMKQFETLAEREAAHEVVGMLGGLPLALVHAATYLGEFGSVTSYRDRLKRSEFGDVPRQIFGECDERVLPTDHAPIALTFPPLFDELRDKEKSPVAADLLTVFSFLDPDDIPFRLLFEQIDSPFPHDSHLARALEMPPEDLAAEIRIAHQLALVDRCDEEAGNCSVHRAVQFVRRSQLSKNQTAASVHAGLKLVLGAFPELDEYSQPHWDTCERLLTHARRLLEVQTAWEDDSRDVAAILACRLAEYFNLRVQFDDAKWAIGLVLKHMEVSSSPALAMTCLKARIERTFGRPEMALFDHVVEQLAPEADAGTLTDPMRTKAYVRAWIGAQHRMNNPFGQATDRIVALVRSVDRGSRLLGEVYYFQAKVLEQTVKMADDLTTRRYAISAAKNVLQKAMQHFDDRDPGKADCLRVLCRVYELDGNSTGTMELRERAFNIIQAWFGDEHPTTSEGRLPVLQLKSGQEAIDGCNDALAVIVRSYGPRHQKVAIAWTTAADIYRNSRMPAERIRALERAVDAWPENERKTYWHEFAMYLIRLAKGAIEVLDFTRAAKVLNEITDGGFRGQGAELDIQGVLMMSVVNYDEWYKTFRGNDKWREAVRTMKKLRQIASKCGSPDALKQSLRKREMEVRDKQRQRELRSKKKKR